MPSVYVPRPDYEELLSGAGRALLYGRRKTGKTTLARHVLGDWLYVYVKPGGEFFLPEEGATYNLRSFAPLLRRGKVIVDEFHRAPRDLLYLIQSGEAPGDLVLISSTLHLVKEFTYSGDAPLKGLFTEIPVSLIHPLDLLRFYRPRRPSDLERLLFYQEPTQVGKELYPILEGSLEFSLSLLSEVLSEEDLSYSKRLAGILRATAAGARRPSEIASLLYRRGLIPKENTGLIAKYLDVLVETGFLERVRVHGSRRRIVRHASPLTAFAFYVDEKYGFYEGLSLWGKEFLLRVFRLQASFYVERFLERLLSRLWGLQPVKILNPEVDVALTRFQRLAVVAEVKWRERVTCREVRAAEEKLSLLPAERRILFVPSADAVDCGTGLEVWDVGRLTEESLAA